MLEWIRFNTNQLMFISKTIIYKRQLNFYLSLLICFTFAVLYWLRYTLGCETNWEMDDSGKCLLSCLSFIQEIEYCNNVANQQNLIRKWNACDVCVCACIVCRYNAHIPCILVDISSKSRLFIYCQNCVARFPLIRVVSQTN